MALTGCAVTGAFWTGGTIGGALSASPTAERLWLGASLVGSIWGPIAIVIFALEYTGHQRYVTRGTVGPLVATGAAFLGLAWTNSVHELFYSTVDTAASTPTGLSTSPGPVFWVFVAVSYALLAVGSFLLVRYAVNLPKLYRKQTVAILVGVFAPWATNVPVALQLINSDITPIGLAVTALALYVAMFQYQLGDILPVALRRVFETVSTGIYVLDRTDRVVEINRAGREMLDAPDDVIGSHARMLAPSDEIYERFRDVQEGQEVVELPSEHSGEDVSSDSRYYDIQVRPVETTSGGRVGRLFVLNDVTITHRQQRRLERQVRDHRGRRRRLIRTAVTGIPLQPSAARLSVLNRPPAIRSCRRLPASSLLASRDTSARVSE